MKKVIGLFLVALIGASPVFAQENNNDKRERKDFDPSKRMERMAESLKLDEKQKAEFEKINKDFMQKMQEQREANREKMEAMRAEMQKQRESMTAMMKERNEEMKKILSDEQYQQFIERQKPPRNNRRGDMPRERRNRDRPSGTSAI